MTSSLRIAADQLRFDSPTESFASTGPAQPTSFFQSAGVHQPVEGRPSADTGRWGVRATQTRPGSACETDDGTFVIDCGDCVMRRTQACTDCVVQFVLLSDEERSPCVVDSSLMARLGGGRSSFGPTVVSPPDAEVSGDFDGEFSEEGSPTDRQELMAPPARKISLAKGEYQTLLAFQEAGLLPPTRHLSSCVSSGR